MTKEWLYAASVLGVGVLLVMVGWFADRRAARRAAQIGDEIAYIFETVRLNGVGVAGAALMMLVNVVGIAVLLTSRSVLQEISGLLLWIGCNVLCAVMILAGQRRTYVVRRRVSDGE